MLYPRNHNQYFSKWNKYKLIVINYAVISEVWNISADEKKIFSKEEILVSERKILFYHTYEENTKSLTSH